MFGLASGEEKEERDWAKVVTVVSPVGVKQRQRGEKGRWVTVLREEERGEGTKRERGGFEEKREEYECHVRVLGGE